MTIKFLNLEKQLNDSLNTEINIYIRQRGSRSRDTIIENLIFPTKEESKTFLTIVKKKFGINGSLKIIEEINEENEVFIFTGNYSEKIKSLLISSYGKKDEQINIHGGIE